MKKGRSLAIKKFGVSKGKRYLSAGKNSDLSAIVDQEKRNLCLEKLMETLREHHILHGDVETFCRLQGERKWLRSWERNHKVEVGRTFQEKGKTEERKHLKKGKGKGLQK